MRLLLLSVAVLLAACTPADEPETEHEQPNILLILSDDHAAYAMGAYGSPIAQTPNLDRLASQGVRFTRAYVNSPFCTASRQSLLTGLMPHRVEVTQLRTALAEEAVTLADVLGARGYATAAFGKMHFNSGLRHGFDTLAYRAEHQAYLALHTPAPPLPEGETLGRWRPFQDHARDWLNAGYLPGSYLSGREGDHGNRLADMDGTFLVDRAAEYLREGREEPFFLIVSFGEPHSPFHFPVEFAGRYDPDTLAVPEVGPDDADQIPLIFRDLTEAEKRGINASYYTSVAYLDHNVGRLLDSLEAHGLADDTFVVYAGDHGYSLGHHGRFEKHTFYEESIHAPVLMRWPERLPEGEVEDALVEFVDFFPTLAAAAGAPVPDSLHGGNLWLVLDGEVEALRDAVVGLYTENEEAMIRTDEWKLIYTTGRRHRQDGYETHAPTPGRTVRLYHLSTDPGEFHDRSAEPEQTARIAGMKARLLERLEATASPDLRAPAALKGDDRLDWYLVPPEVRRGRDRGGA